MVLKSISINNFRNLDNKNINFENYFNVFYGKNGQGKTNILESIYLLFNLKSFRFANNIDFIKFGHSYSTIVGISKCNNIENNYNLKIEKSTKNLLINDKKPNHLSDFYGDLKVIVFTPDDTNIVKGYPAVRRALLDRAIFLSSPTYLKDLKHFNNCLKQRNSLLKAPDKSLDVWTEFYINAAVKVYKERINYIQRIKPIFNKIYSNINYSKELVDIIYLNNLTDINYIKKKLEDDLDKNNYREKEFGMTLYGPHKDDLEFYINEKHIKAYGSQGQQKSFILAFKAAQVLDIKNQTGYSPILLLDDISSELDMDRQKDFLKFLIDNKGQTFITTTDNSFYEKNLKNENTFYEIKDGKII